MSLADTIALKPITVKDRRLAWDPSQDSSFAVKKGGSVNSYQVFTTTSSSSSNIQWTASPPAPNVAFSRNVLARVGFSVVFNGCANTGVGNFYVKNSGAIAPRAYPLANCTNTVSVQMNGNTFTQQNYMVVNAFQHIGKDNYSRNTNASMSPDMPDFYQEYNDGYDYQGTGTPAGITVDPLQAVGQSVGQLVPRGAWEITDANPGATTATLQFYSTESLLLSPFCTGEADEEAFVGVQSLTVSLALQNLARCLSINDTLLAAQGRTYTSLTVSIISQPQLIFNYISSHQTDEIPRSISYTYTPTVVYPTGTFSVASGASSTQTSNNIQFSVIPTRLVVFVRRQDADLDETTADTFAGITNAVITFDNRTILSTTTSETLYQISHKNGLNMSYPAFSKYTGSVLIFDVANDLTLSNPAEAPSLATTKQFNIQLTFKNLSSATVSYTMYVVAINSGLFTIAENAVYLQQSVLSPEDIMRAERSDWVSPSEMTDETFYGGGMFKKLKNIGKMAAKFAKKTGIASAALDLAGQTKAADMARSAGFGYEKYLGAAKLPKKALRLMN